MTRSKSAMDSADNVQKFIAQMKPSNGNNSWSASAKPAAAQQNGHATPNDDEIGPILVSQPIDIPARAARTASPELHPLPSPHVGGLLAPQNTPYTRPVSPLAMPAELAAHNQVVSGAFSDFVNNVEGRPLSEFFWAPAQVAARAAATPRGGSRTTPRNLTPTSIVTPNPAINGSFERMSFKAADQDQGHKIGGNIFGDRNTRSALTNAGAKQPSASPVYVTKSAMQSAQPVGVWLADQPGNSSMGRQPFSATKNASQPTDPVSAEPASPSTQISMGKQPLPTMKLTTQPTEPVSAEASSPSTSSIPMIKAASWLGRTLSRGSKDPQKAKASTDNSLFSNLHALEASGGLSPDQLAFFKNVTNQAVANDNAQPTKADEPPEPVAEKPTEMPTKANGVKNAVDSEESMMGKAEQADALVNKLHLKEKELKDLGASNAAMHAGLADLRDNLRQKEKAWKDYEVVWAGKEAKLEEEITELRAELTRIEGVIEKLRIKQKELKALDISNAGQGGLLVKVIQDTRHELTHKEEAYKDVEALNGRKQAKLEEEVKELRAALQTMTTKKVAPESKVPVNATKIAKKKGKVDGNLEHQTFFSKWPQSEKRDRARKSTSLSTLITSLIYDQLPRIARSFSRISHVMLLYPSSPPLSTSGRSRRSTCVATTLRLSSFLILLIVKNTTMIPPTELYTRRTSRAARLLFLLSSPRMLM